jgi:hypothetical protein
MRDEHEKMVQKRLDGIVELLKLLAAIELNDRGVKHQIIGKRLHIAKAKVGELLKGVAKGDDRS